MQTVVSPLEFSPDEYNIVVMPSAALVQKIVQLQDQIKSRLGDAVWFMPPSCLHVTIMEILCHADYGDQSRRALFEQWQVKYGATAKELLALCDPVELHFTEVLVSAGAIIIKTADSKPLNDIRSKLLKQVELPKGTKLPPDITHCSIARYNKSIDLEQAQQAARDLRIDFNESVEQFKLMTDLVPPDFTPTCIDTYGLKT